jgi:hypothetical protein
VIDLDETTWSFTSPLVKRISGSKNFRSSPQNDFCNIGTNAKCQLHQAMSEFMGTAENIYSYLVLPTLTHKRHAASRDGIGLQLQRSLAGVLQPQHSMVGGKS